MNDMHIKPTKGNMGYSRRTVYAVGSFALLTLVVMIAGFWSIGNDIRNAESKYLELDVQIKNQNALIHRSLGTIIPIVLPPEIEKEIIAIEDQLSKKSNWPTSVHEIAKLSDRLADLVNSLPPWSQEDLLPRLVPKRWELGALSLLTSELEKDPDNLSQYLKNTEQHLAQKPLGASDELERLLSDRRREAQVKLGDVEYRLVLEVAKKAVETRQDVESAARRLSSYTDPEANKLAAELDAVMVALAYERALNGLKNELAQYDQLQDRVLREFAYVRARGKILDLRVQSLTSKTDSKIIDAINELEKMIAGSIKKIEDERQTRYTELRRQYQVWALGEIKKVRSYESIVNHEKEKLSGYFKGKESKNNAMVELRNDLIRLMAPINQDYLDPAVANWYRKVYEQRFSKLDDDNQLAVVEGFATADKAPLE